MQVIWRVRVCSVDVAIDRRVLYHVVLKFTYPLKCSPTTKVMDSFHLGFSWMNYWLNLMIKWCIRESYLGEILHIPLELNGWELRV